MLMAQFYQNSYTFHYLIYILSQWKKTFVFTLSVSLSKSLYNSRGISPRCFTDCGGTLNLGGTLTWTLPISCRCNVHLMCSLLRSNLLSRCFKDSKKLFENNLNKTCIGSCPRSIQTVFCLWLRKAIDFMILLQKGLDNTPNWPQPHYPSFPK